MIDFLRSNPWCSLEEYKWGLTVPQIKLAEYDFSHIEYLKTKEELAEARKDIVIDDGEDLKNLSDLGIPIM
jgi:S-adenosylhomocysteine hydrolase